MNQRKPQQPKIVALRNQNRPTQEIQSQAQNRLDVLLEAAGDNALLQEIISETSELLTEMVARNRELANKYADEMEKRIIMESRVMAADAEVEEYREKALEMGLSDLAYHLSKGLDLYPNGVQRVIRLVMGQYVLGTVDDIPPYHREQLRELFQDIERMCLELDIDEAEGDAS